MTACVCKHGPQMTHCYLLSTLSVKMEEQLRGMLGHSGDIVHKQNGKEGSNGVSGGVYLFLDTESVLYVTFGLTSIYRGTCVQKVYQHDEG